MYNLFQSRIAWIPLYYILLRGLPRVILYLRLVLLTFYCLLIPSPNQRILCYEPMILVARIVPIRPYQSWASTTLVILKQWRHIAGRKLVFQRKTAMEEAVENIPNIEALGNPTHVVQAGIKPKSIGALVSPTWHWAACPSYLVQHFNTFFQFDITLTFCHLSLIFGKYHVMML